ncbi:MAG: membrane protein insertion efficiency factor YidD [Oscillospiraceae bacterium]|nr:membrane protein insertion efficiency factor YidD [Oscillospiraceae bacterium]
MKAKPFVINAVLLYQKHAPERIRRSCLFVPSCSEYMLLAVGKYGVLIGVYKGLHRLLRCHHPNGGEDYP